MIAEGYAEVVDAIRQKATAADDANGVIVVQDYACIADRSPDHMTEPGEVTTQGNNFPVKREGKSNVLLFPLRQHSLVKDKKAILHTRSECASHSESKTPNSSTEHLYDSLNTSTSSQDPIYHILEPPRSMDQRDRPDGPHFYHVLEGPTKAVNPDEGAPKSITPQPPLPPKPMSGFVYRHWMKSSVTVSPMDSQSDKKTVSYLQSNSTTSKRSISDQLSSVMAIYEEVPAERRETSSSLLLPPRVGKPGMPAQEKEDHVYPVLEAFSPVENMSRVPQAMQNKEQTLKENNGSVMQTCDKQDEDKLKTKEVCSKQELPKMAKEQPLESAEEKKYAEPFSSQKRLSNDHVCNIFDDPAYCTQSHTVGSTQKLGKDCEGGSIVDQSHFDDPSYATPSVNFTKSKELNPHPECLFDDPQYNCTQIELNFPQTMKVDDQHTSLNEQLQKRKPLHSRVLEGGKQTVRHSSSVEYFSALVYSSTQDFLETADHGVIRGSMDNLTDCSYLDKSRVHKKTNLKFDNPKHRFKSVALKVTDL